MRSSASRLRSGELICDENLFLGDADLPIGPEEELPLQCGPFVGRRVDGRQHVGGKSSATFARRPGTGGRRQAVQFVAYPLRFGLPPIETPSIFSQLPVRADGRLLDGNDACKERLQTVKVVLLDRVELVVVTLRAADRQTQEHRAHVAGQIVERVLPGECDDRRIAFVGPHPQISGGNLSVDLVGKQFVAGQLLRDEPVVRHVGIERTNDVIAELPRQRADGIGVVAGRLGKADEIEPQAAPRLAVVRIGQQPIDQPLVGVDGRIADECVDLGRRRRQAQQVEFGPANQFGTGGRRGQT